MRYKCDWNCGSYNVTLLKTTNQGGTPNKHLECRDCGMVWTEATFLSPVVKKDDSNEGGA